MSLKNLKLANAAPANSLNPQQRGREKLLSYLVEQKKLVQAEAGGLIYEATRTVRRKNEAGVMITVQAPRHVRSGTFAAADGNLYFQLRYGSKPLALGKDANAVVVPSKAKLPDIIDALVAAIGAGELDEQIAAAAAARRANFKPKDGTASSR